MISEEKEQILDFIIKRCQEIWRGDDNINLYLYIHGDDFILEVDDEHIGNEMLTSLQNDFDNTYWLDTLIVEAISENNYQLIWTNYLPF